MKKYLFLLAVSLGFTNSVFAVEGNADAGQAKSAMCAACHNADGNSLVPMYPKLAGQSATYLAKQLADFKAGAMSGGSTGRNDPIMGGMVMALSEQDMADLAAYYAGQTVTAGDGSTNEAGHKLYFGGDAERGITACVACHGVNGVGMAAAAFPSVAGQNMEYLKGQLEKFRTQTRANDNSAMMRNIAKKLNDEEIKNITQFMSSLNK